MNKLLITIITVIIIVIGCAYRPKNGTNGTSCSVVEDTDGSTITCSDGTHSFVPNGAVGAQGPAGIGVAGPIGPQGNPGLPGTIITPVQFCTNYTPSYPSTFPEYGICLGGSLYAVYWDGHNSWLSIIPNGSYESTSTSAPCNFTVNGCTIN